MKKSNRRVYRGCGFDFGISPKYNIRRKSVLVYINKTKYTNDSFRLIARRKEFVND